STRSTSVAPASSAGSDSASASGTARSSSRSWPSCSVRSRHSRRGPSRSRRPASSSRASRCRPRSSSATPSARPSVKTGSARRAAPRRRRRPDLRQPRGRTAIAVREGHYGPVAASDSTTPRPYHRRMRYRRFGTSDLVISEVGLGTWTLASDWWGRVDDPNAFLAAALDCGITFIDTAPVYGEAAVGETMLAPFLRAHRDEIVLTTKCGYDIDAPRIKGQGERPQDFSPDGVRRQLDASLRRLGTDRIDL